MTRIRLATVLALVALLVSCGFLTTKIGDIRENPEKYDGKTVTVKGEVKSATNLAVVKFYVLDDGTGEIRVVTERTLPKEGKEVRARGTVHRAFSIGSMSFVVIEEKS